jgi:hypothetical protein
MKSYASASSVLMPRRLAPREIESFLFLCVEPADGLWVQADDLYAAYTSWAEDKGQVPVSQTAFGRGLRGVLEKWKYGQVRYLNIKLIGSCT